MFKRVFQDLQDYRRKMHKHFFSLKTISKLFLETAGRTKFYILLALIMLVVCFRPMNREPGDFEIFQLQMIGFVVIAACMFAFLVHLYHSIALHYFNHFHDTYISFIRLLRISLTFVFIIFSVGFLGLRTLYVNAYFEPKLEICTYYDWYGNKIYQPQTLGACPSLNIRETDFLNTIEFDVQETRDQKDYLVVYRYTYENMKLKERKIEAFPIVDNHQASEPVFVEITVNTYEQNRFTSTRTTTETGKETVVTTIEANRLDDETIKVTTLLTTDGGIEKEEDRLLNSLSFSGTKTIATESYLYQAFDNDQVLESYYTSFNYKEAKEIKVIEYITNPRVTYWKTPFIKNMTVNNQNHQFNMVINGFGNGIARIEHFIGDELSYINRFTYLDYGYQVEHYSFHRDSWGRIVDPEDRYRGTYCYASNDTINTNDFTYGELTNKKDSTYCAAPIFSTDNPIFLNND